VENKERRLIMNMLPIFMIGLIVGIALSYAWYKYKEDVPSKVKVELQEKEIKRQKSDNEMLHNLIDKLYKKIDELEKENKK
jgi:hypothetical protein